MDDGGRFGRWTTDADGEPCFDFALEAAPRDQATQATQAARGARGARADLVLPAGGAGRCWHQIGSFGNGAGLATASADGDLTIYATARGFVRLTGPGGAWGLLGPHPGEAPRARFGPGYAQWTVRYDDAEVVRRVDAPPDGGPALRIAVTVRTQRPAVYRERPAVSPYPLFVGGLMSHYLRPPADHRQLAWWHLQFATAGLSRALTDRWRRHLARRLAVRHEYRPAWRGVAFEALRPSPPKPRPAWFDAHLPRVFLALVDGPSERPDGPGLIVPLDEPGEHHIVFALGLAEQEADVPEVLARTAAPPRRVPPLRLSPDGGQAETAREAVWHASYLLGARVRDDWLGRYVTQGSAYAYVHGLQGAPRDYALSAVPLCFLDPPAARDLVEVMLRLTRPDGAMYYAHTGAGRVTSAGIHASPTDLPLFLLWVVSEYVWATGDRAFLERPVPFHSAGGITSTVRERVLLAFHRLRDHVGRGPHGMLRVGSGDWSDPISAMVSDRRAFHRLGESGFNTAFGAWVLPRAADLVGDTHPGAAAEMREFGQSLAAAMEAAWTGRWFARGWDGRGNAVGADHLFLDGQVWCLIARIGSADLRRTLVHEIARRCDDPSPIGATILDRPHRVRHGILADGWDVNGGVWAALNALLAWGYALHDPVLAWRLLAKQSLAAHARAYPHVWYGIWSGPDAYNAWFGSHPGETFVQPATPMTEYPVMNSNTHAGALLALLRVLGIETGPDGVRVRDSADDGAAWRLETALGSFSGHLPAQSVSG